MPMDIKDYLENLIAFAMFGLASVVAILMAFKAVWEFVLVMWFRFMLFIRSFRS